jgi:hypothetical protein
MPGEIFENMKAELERLKSSGVARRVAIEEDIDAVVRALQRALKQRLL